MKQYRYFRINWIIILLLMHHTISYGGKQLWTIGSPNRNNAEFSLAPDDLWNFKNDAFYIIGQSDPASDWPYVHPGPRDGWGGNKSHTFTILFGLSDFKTADGECCLTLDLLDTHQGDPGILKIFINQHIQEYKLPDGAGDESVNGKPEAGSPCQVQFRFPLNQLIPGTNEIEITKDNGSWLLYDAVSLLVPDGVESQPVKNYFSISSFKLESAILKTDQKLVQKLSVIIKNAEKKINTDCFLDGSFLGTKSIGPGVQVIEFYIPEITETKVVKFEIKHKNKSLESITETLNPSGHRTVFILPHSHTDIGYTDYQPAIEDKQVENLKEGISYARETADYPEGARFVWNVEVSWAADLYLNRLGTEDQELFFEALKKGWISLNGMYLNELTGLCRPEELLRLFRYSTQLAEKTGMPVDAAMISDVPGYTWGTVTAMAQAGIKYFSVAPNYFDRIGDILVEWENKPFYWVGPSGKEKVLVWIPFKGYAWSHTVSKLNEAHAADFLAQLDAMNYPYDIAYMRWSGHGDNAVPEKQISDFVREWNEKYAWPRFVISSTSTAFRTFEEQYGKDLPSVKGDWTPYWEDGAGSAALETGINRNTADRLTQAASLFSMASAKKYPAADFDEAWKQTLLYSEHTWGAWCSITDPENPMTTGQWAIKKNYADAAAQMSWELLNRNLSSGENTDKLLVINTLAWNRADKIWIPKENSQGVQLVLDENQEPVSSQRLSDGRLLILTNPIPAFSREKYSLSSETAPKGRKENTSNIVQGNVLDNGLVRVEIDPKTGSIKSIKAHGTEPYLADTQSDYQLNQYLFLEGADIQDLETNGPVELRITENGPVYGVLEARSEAPGCVSLVRRYQLTKGQDYLEIENRVDKTRAPLPEKIGDWFLAQNKNKESINFAFPMAVPHGIMELDLPIGSMVPWKDQIPSACKNWYTVGRYGDVSNDRFGMTWFTLDAPLVEVGEISATLIGSQSNPGVWRKTTEPTQTLYSWALNNHWGTNYRQYQEGLIVFRYALRPHQKFDRAETYRLATAMTQPLLISYAETEELEIPFDFESKGLVVVSTKPADDGNGKIIRIYNPCKETQSGSLKANQAELWLSNTSERKLSRLGSEFQLDGMELITIRLEKTASGN